MEVDNKSRVKREFFKCKNGKYDRYDFPFCKFVKINRLQFLLISNLKSKQLFIIKV